MKEYYDTMTEALKDLNANGYTYDFNLMSEAVQCNALDREFAPSEFEVDHVYRFEGASSAGDSSVLYAITADNQYRGTLVDAYGADAEALDFEMAQKLRMNNKK